MKQFCYVVIVSLVVSSCMASSCTCMMDVSTSNISSLVTVGGPNPSVVVNNRAAIASAATKNIGNNTLFADDSGRVVATMLIACALNKRDSIKIGDLEFFGESNLAPEWKFRALSKSGRDLVSACVLAHLSIEGLAVPFSMRGTDLALAVSRDEKDSWPVEEGAFFGDIFASTDSPLNWNACRGNDSINVRDRSCAKEDPQRLGFTLCGFIFTGDCADTCHRNNGHYEKCSTSDQLFHEVITTFVAN